MNHELLAELAAIKSGLETANARIDKLSLIIANSEQSDVYRDLRYIRDGYGFGRNAVKGAIARGELVANRAERGRIIVKQSELDRWIASRPYKAPKRDVADLAEWQDDIEQEFSKLVPPKAVGQ